ncbi:MAG: COX15/CtaA family protein [bacterium]|nr:COX15/CtaA family protein [bacterium]
MKKTLLALSVLVFVLIILGGITRIIGAGLSCPDWPLCFGQFIPPLDPYIFAEWFHRLIASIAGAITVIVAFWIFTSKTYRPRIGWLMGIALALLLLQIWLGGATVLQQLASWTVTMHLIIGYSFLTVLLLMAFQSEESRTPSFSSFTFLSFFMLGVTLVQVALGGLVSANYAGLACPDFPTCFGEWIPPLRGLVVYQFFHRLGALIVTIGLLALVFKLKGSGLSKKGRRALMTAGPLVILQIIFGVLAIHTHLHQHIRLAHVLVALSLFVSVLVTTYESRYRS